jgi:LmbE family N-acetylglucosaminyl deacetylase
MKKKIIAIGAHPDDIEIGCGGTIKQFINQNDEVFFIIATLGEKCNVNGFENSELINKRREEAISSSGYLGVKDVFFLGLQDTNIQQNGENVSALELIINKINPVFVFTHTREDNHQDHRSLALLTISACRRKAINILHYESPSTALNFLPAVFSDISETMTSKMEAISFFTSQNEKIYVDKDAIRGLAKYRGYISGSDYAEAFEISKYYIFPGKGY